MKRLVFKRWVLELLVAIGFIAIMVMASDSDNIKVFVISHIVATVILIINYLLLKKYSDIFD